MMKMISLGFFVISVILAAFLAVFVSPQSPPDPGCCVCVWNGTRPVKTILLVPKNECTLDKCANGGFFPVFGPCRPFEFLRVINAGIFVPSSSAIKACSMSWFQLALVRLPQEATADSWFPLASANCSNEDIEAAYNRGEKCLYVDESVKLDFEKMQKIHRWAPSAMVDPSGDGTYSQTCRIERVTDPKDPRVIELAENLELERLDQEDYEKALLEAHPEAADEFGRLDRRKLESDTWSMKVAWTRYPLPFGHRGSRNLKPFSKVERSYALVSNAIRRKSDWEQKFKDNSIWNKWKEEIVPQLIPRQMNPDDAVADPAAQYLYEYRRLHPLMGALDEDSWELMRQELSWISSRKSGSLEPAAVDGVWQADGIIPEDILDSLKIGVGHLENVPESQKDWHPGSNKQVLDLVHPSLFPLVYGKSRKLLGAQQAIPSLKFMGGGETLHCPFQKDPPAENRNWGDEFLNEDHAVSVKYQWLPAEFDVAQDGSVRIMSYINNLHPIQHKGLYHTIEKIFEKFIPLFEKVLDDVTDQYRLPRFEIPEMPLREEGIKFPYAFTDTFVDEPEESHESLCAKIPPITVNKWREPEPWPHMLNSLRGKRLQVIVKLANIVLTPENPTYPGGAWHVEGMENERIVASGIYYYESSNISESLLTFRYCVDSPTYQTSSFDGYEQGYYRWYYGLMNGNPLNEGLGSVETKAGRMIAFPNVLQHQVQPFELQDKTKPGVRKILVFFLVAPDAPVLSTANIPPQQREWYADALRREIPEFYRLPMDIVQTIVGFVRDCPMSLETAKKHRAKLMTERKYTVDETNKRIFERQFSLCEH